MSRAWYSYCKIKTPPECLFFYQNALKIGFKVFAFHQRHMRQYTKIAELDLKTLKCTEFLSPNYDFNQHESLITSWACSYEENILIYSLKRPNEQAKLLKINTITHHVDIINLDFDGNEWGFDGMCVIKDHVYVFVKHYKFTGILIVSVNLKTIEKKMIQFSNEECINDLLHFKCVDNESNINFFYAKKPFIAIFNTTKHNWRTIKNVNFADYENHAQFMLSNDVVVFKKNQLPQYNILDEILNFNSMKWRFGSVGGKRQSDDTFSYYFEFYGKLATIKNPQNSIGRSHDPEAINKSNLPGSDDLKIYVLNLYPNLQSLCAIKIAEFNLDHSKLPKKLQNEIKQYVTI
ncbi:hypothetical protein CHUAL_008957 [Chamberlinius hualienensis]